MGDGGVGQGVDHLGALLDDPRLFEVGAHHEPGDVLEEHQRRVLPVAELDEVGGLLGGLRVDDAVVAEDSDRVAVDGGEPADHCRPVPGLEILESGTVDHPTDDLPDVDRLLEIPGHHAHEALDVVDRFGRLV